ncbi:hypothetical protein SS50377_27660 [Spironucleus salmonicida]|nr:hypothetical protein SS50377_27660 [Spironucleus salmonicida]
MNISASLQFKFYCGFEYYQPLDEIANIFFTSRQKEKIITIYHLNSTYRNDSLILNLVHHLCQFLSQFTEYEIPLIESIDHFQPKNPIEFEFLTTQKVTPHMIFIKQEQDIFCTLFNQIYQPQNNCLSSADVFKALDQFSSYIKQNYSSDSLIQLITHLKIPQVCTCNFEISGLIISSSIEKIAVQCGIKSSLPDHVKRINQILIKSLKSLCILRNWLLNEIETKNNSRIIFQDDKSVLFLLKENKRIKIQYPLQLVQTGLIQQQKENSENSIDSLIVQEKLIQSVCIEQQKYVEFSNESEIRNEILFSKESAKLLLSNQKELLKEQVQQQSTQTEKSLCQIQSIQTVEIEQQPEQSHDLLEIKRFLQLLEQKLTNKLDLISIQYQEVIMKVDDLNSKVAKLEKQIK